MSTDDRERAPTVPDRSKEEPCATAPSVTNSAVQPATGSTCNTGTKPADTWRTVIVGLPIIRKLMNGEDVSLETFRVSLIPDDVLWNNRPARAAVPDREREIVTEFSSDGPVTAISDGTIDNALNDLESHELRGIEQGLADLAAGRVKPLKQIKAELAARASTPDLSRLRELSAKWRNRGWKGIADELDAALAELKGVGQQP